MKKYALVLLLPLNSSRSLTDVVSTAPTGNPSLDYTLIIGVVAVVVLLIVRRVRKRKQM
ncbi:hypothetical protein GO755_05710 [Spirosoma sp. HMF4905]|uniref:LPXTG cell wall anchor domain-containing protein n=1 Tax=Spirosoma arboris TaxID=2682092 RepID=A0A7K1S6R4_9BACT|nr:hypothetical protein [Spirosoma arboris]MVM29519.1 hypothetical protein [Spirosoma arboris]